MMLLVLRLPLPRRTSENRAQITSTTTSSSSFHCRSRGIPNIIRLPDQTSYLTTCRSPYIRRSYLFYMLFTSRPKSDAISIAESSAKSVSTPCLATFPIQCSLETQDSDFPIGLFLYPVKIKAAYRCVCRRHICCGRYYKLNGLALFHSLHGFEHAHSVSGLKAMLISAPCLLNATDSSLEMGLFMSPSWKHDFYWTACT
jgi:hypothetical protein